MNWKGIIEDIKKWSGMRNIDIVRYVKIHGVDCVPSQITRLANGRQLDVGFEVGEIINDLRNDIYNIYWGGKHLAHFGAKFNTGVNNEIDD